MTQDYRYTAFGLSILSDIPFIELNSSHDNDCDLRINSVKTFQDFHVENDSWYHVEGNTLSFEVEDVARFKVSNGTTIEYEKLSSCHIDDLRLFILGSAMAAIQFQRGELPLHAGAYLIHDKAVLISGDSGAGKSTTGYALYKEGFPLVADDMSVLKMLNGELRVCSGYPQMKLWKESLDIFNISEDGLKRVREADEKYRLVADNFQESSVELSTIVFLSKGTSISIEEVQGIALLELLYANIFRAFFMEDSDQAKTTVFKLFDLPTPDRNLETAEAMQGKGWGGKKLENLRKSKKKKSEKNT